MVKTVWLAALAALSMVGTAQAEEPMETRLAEEGAQPARAALEQVEWLIGQWKGTGIGGAPALESWLPAAGRTMVGIFIQQGEDGEVRFTEHLHLIEEEGSLVLRLKHFNADLTGWEEKDDMVTFRLAEIEPCAAYFHGLTLRCADPERPGEGLVAAVRMQSGGELVFRYEPIEPDSAG